MPVSTDPPEAGACITSAVVVPALEVGRAVAVLVAAPVPLHAPDKKSLHTFVIAKERRRNYLLVFAGAAVVAAVAFDFAPHWKSRRGSYTGGHSSTIELVSYDIHCSL